MPEISAGKSVNQATGKVVNTTSRFDLSYPLGGTYRFGEYAPNFVMECVPKDRNVRLQSIHDVRSTSLKAPLLSDIKLNKDYFRVNMEAILPFNWDKIYTNPVIGDDVNPYKANCILDVDFCNQLVAYYWRGLVTSIQVDDVDNDHLSLRFFDTLIALEKFFSKGSLLASLGCNLSHYLTWVDTNGKLRSFDEVFDLSVQMWKDIVFRPDNPDLSLYARSFTCVDFMDFRYRVFPSAQDVRKFVDSLSQQNASSLYQYIDFNTFLSIYREDGIKSITLNDSSDNRFDFIDVVHLFDGYYVQYSLSDEAGNDAKSGVKSNIDSKETLWINISRVLAYQLACAHFYTNDHVDFIYSAQLYRQLVHYHFIEMFRLYTLYSGDDRVNHNLYFDYNGVETEYDYLSGAYWGKLADYLYELSSYEESTEDFNIQLISLLNSVFSFRPSLRYKDYFTGSRTQPLAVGDVNIPVSGGDSVSVVDTTQKIQMQRFLNSVNRGKRQFKEYIENLFPGLQVAGDPHDPSWLAHTSDVIYDNEVENTGESQQIDAVSVTSTLKSNASRYAFEVDIDRPCILIGIMYFDIERYYGDTIERQYFHIDRFDMFNPFMQFIGDQVVYQAEKGNFSALVQPYFPFSYQLRHAEYKQRFPQYFGGFSPDTLPGWLFRYQPQSFPYLTPRFIRSCPAELDPFFISLTGTSLKSYFHFIVKNRNIVSADRPMVFAPSIL